MSPPRAEASSGPAADEPFGPSWVHDAAPCDGRTAVLHVAEDGPRLAGVVWALADAGVFVQYAMGLPPADFEEFDLEAIPVEPTGPYVAERVQAAIESLAPVVVVVHGEGELALLAALGAARLGLPVVRVGAVSGDHGPGRVIDRLADLVLVHDEEDAIALDRAGIPQERVHVVGNPLPPRDRAPTRPPVPSRDGRAGARIADALTAGYVRMRLL